MKITFDIERLVPKYIMQDRNGRALAKAIEAGMKYVAKKAEDGLDIITDPDKMPEWRLDEMAQEYGIPFDFTASISQKRQWIKNAIPMYRILGTKQAIKQYLDGYFGEVEVEESWEYSGDPFHFRVTVGGEWTPATEAWARKAIRQTKPVRSTLDDFRIGCNVRFAILATGEVKDRFRFPSAGEIWAGEYPWENIQWEIDNPPGQSIHVEDFDGRISWDMAGEKPEINHLLSLDNTPAEGNQTEEIVNTIYYPLCGEPICGE